mgnify:CR=1 FL=1
MTELTKTWKDRIQELDGFDWCILPFIYLEAFVVNILHNANIEVPDRVSLRKEDNTPIPPVVVTEEVAVEEVSQEQKRPSITDV